jgi:ppGpp synthetase/RelA/SpoT-type nucleotidyltranferase
MDVMSEGLKEDTAIELSSHEQAAVSAYLRVQPFYNDLASVIARLIQECVKKRQIKVHSVQYRAKEASSFGRKAAIPSEIDPEKPKYSDPLTQITDLAGVRVITHFPSTLVDIDRLLSDEFDILERSDKSIELIEEEKFGYQSIHYLARIKPDRARLAEYERFADATAEIQVRTILQHAWAEIEHDIQYKSANIIPFEIRRRFMSLAGMLELADREFQAIQDADKQLESHAKAMVQTGDLGGVEITPNALKLFLDKRLGSDGRISDWSYDWTARLLKRLGFQDLKQVEAAIAPYDDDKLSNLMWGGRQGQTNRFETMLLAALGERFMERHQPSSQFLLDHRREALDKFARAGIPIGRYDPTKSDRTPQPR